MWVVKGREAEVGLSKASLLRKDNKNSLRKVTGLGLWIGVSMSAPTCILGLLHMGCSFSCLFWKCVLIIRKVELKRQWERGKERDTNLLSAGSFPKWLSRAKARSLGLLPGFSCAFRGPSIWIIIHCFSRHISKELDWKWSQWDFEMAPKWDDGSTSPVSQNLNFERPSYNA